MPISLSKAFQTFDEHWTPRIIGELNGQHLKIAKVKGAFVWHAHPDADEAFLVHRGSFVMEYRDEAGDVRRETLAAGDLIVIPRGMEHRPVADDECEILLFEPAGLVNTGDADDDRRIEAPVRLPGARAE